MLSLLLQQTIDDELNWREPELALAKLHLHRAIPENRHFRYAYRAFVAMTYAHYEGYSKQVLAQALSDIYSSGAKPAMCVPLLQKTLMLPATRKKLFALSTDDFMVGLGEGMNFLDKVTPPSVDTILECGNLNVENFNWAVSCVGLSPSLFSAHRGTIGRLTSLRHDCAHGEVISFDSSKTNQVLANEIFALQQNTTTLMHLLAVELLDHFTHKRYLVPRKKGKNRKKK